MIRKRTLAGFCKPSCKDLLQLQITANLLNLYLGAVSDINVQAALRFFECGKLASYEITFCIVSFTVPQPFENKFRRAPQVNELNGHFLTQ